MAIDLPPSTSDSAVQPAARGSSTDALDELWVKTLVELRRIAHQRLRLERAGHTLNTTALVHEVYLRLVGQRKVQWADRGQFFALAAQAMRRTLIDSARRHRRMRDRVQYDSLDAENADSSDHHHHSAVRLAGSQRADRLLALDEALDRLAAFDERLSRVVEMRFFGGYTDEETAEALGVTPRTVTRDWAKAKAWLYRELQDSSGASTTSEST